VTAVVGGEVSQRWLVVRFLDGGLGSDGSTVSYPFVDDKERENEQESKGVR